MKKLGLAVFIAILLSACQTATKPNRLTQGQFEAPIAPGETRLSMRNVDRDKWLAKGADTASAARTAFVCRPLACAAPSVVVYTRLNSPTRKPDPQALLGLAQTTLDKVTANGATVRSAPKLGSVKGFPSVGYAHRKEVNGKIEYTRWIAVFAGSLSFNLQSISQDEATAIRNLDQFLATIEIVDGGSLQTARR
jgi:hypothetical protein